MSMGIEHFRQIVEQKSDLANRRITVERHGTISAPNRLKNRIVDWYKGTETDERRQQQNVRARGVFYEALKKAYGESVANEAIKQGARVGVSDDFLQKTKTFQGSHIEKILKVADRLKTEHGRSNETALQDYIAGGALVTTVVGLKDLLGHPNLSERDPELRAMFIDLVRTDPRFHRKDLTPEELSDLAEQALRQCLDAKKGRFQEQFPVLARFETDRFQDGETWFDSEGREFAGIAGDLGFDQETQDWFSGALNAIKRTPEYLGEMAFDHDNLAIVEEHLEDQLSLLNRIRQAPNFAGGDVMKSVVDDTWQELQQLAPPGHDDSVWPYLRRCFEARLDFGLNNWIPKGKTLADPEARDAVIESMRSGMESVIGTTWPNVSKKDRDHWIDTLLESFGQKFANHDWAGILERRNSPQVAMLERTAGMFKQEIEHQIDLLEAKREFIREYRNHDPLSEKSVAFKNWVMWEATKLYIEDRLGELETLRQKYEGRGDRRNLRRVEHDIALLQRLREQDGNQILSEHVNDAQERWSNADPGPGNDPDHPRTRNTVRNEIRQDRNNVMEFLGPYWGGARFKPNEGRGKTIDTYMIKALDRMPHWKPIKRDIVVPRDGVTRTYRSELIPGSKIGGAVSERYVGGQQGVGALNRTDRTHAPNLQVSRLIHVDPNDPDNGTVKSEVIRHAMLDPWKIEDPQQRMTSSREGAKEVLMTSVELTSQEFKTEALRLNQDGANCEIIHVNIAMRTGDPSGHHLDREEGDFIEYQFEAFGHYDRRNVTLQVFTAPLPKKEEIDLFETLGDDDDQVKNEGRGVNLNEDDSSNDVGVQQHSTDPITIINEESNDESGQSPQIYKIDDSDDSFVGALRSTDQVNEWLKENEFRFKQDSDGENVVNNDIENILIGEESNEHDQPPEDMKRELQLRNLGWDDVRLDLPDDVSVAWTEEAVLKWLSDNPGWLAFEYGPIGSRHGQLDSGEQPNPEIEGRENEGDDLRPRVHNIRFDVKTITFSFGISGERAQSSRFDEHDRINMIRLVGDLTTGTSPGGEIGRIVDTLQRRIDRDDTPDDEKKELAARITELCRQTDLVREEFTSGNYKKETGDPYRMARHVTQLVNLGGQALRAIGHTQIHMSVSESCRNNVDGSGMLDVEHKSQVIIEDMGGRVTPNEPLPEQDRKIFNLVLTGSGQTESQEMTTGMTGSGSTGVIRNRSRDPGAMRYNEGLIKVRV